MSRKGCKLSKEQRKRISESVQKKYDTDPEYKRRHAEACRTKENRQKISSTLRKHYLNPINRQKLREQFTPEVRKKISDAKKKRFQDPKEREKLADANKNWRKSLTEEEYRKFESKRLQALNRSEVRKKIGQSLKKCWRDPEFRKKMSKIRKEYFNRLEVKKRISEEKKRLWANATPEQRVEWNRKNSETHKKMLKNTKFREEHIKRLLKWVKSEEHRKKVSRNSKRMWANMTLKEREARVRKIIEGLQIKPNKPERFLIPILKQFGFRYTGNGDFFLSTSNRIYIPDFINKEQKLIVEFDGIYWHNPTRDAERNRVYKEKGYNILSLNEDNLALGEKYVLNLVTNFIEI